MSTFRVLGCSGGIGGQNRTTSFLLNQTILIDAGTGVGDLSMEELLQIEHVFITHAHLDHIACLPLLIDSTIGARTSPVTVHATSATIQVLKKHIFNWHIWPDFSVIPSAEDAFLRYEMHELGEPYQLDEITITPLPAEHTVPAVAFQINNDRSSIVFSGDTVGGQQFWQVVNQITNLKTLIIETAFAERELSLALLAKHLCPSTLAVELQNLASHVEVLITHLKPADSDLTIAEVLNLDHVHPIRRLLQGEILEF
ncbi:3',5'-cyclic-nucleotide phosphodiesterase [Deefgea tanakiae]|jgi:cAMP phosphodiesterase|uniref:3',5'-cyclic-nucleotide phosphodiesterase n=1 Tax=Deefgea tanakiae TaxID=2865840 RepID=A0ABX8ZB66_9NEIS|nr:3',5'-cyclic-nucleotide phosphodiesterase [Deefgea tanakiae]QZA78383.1 3',5'-cyclic-nucleotide phosphodiesterase [Deefgea tanakiae]